MPAPEDDGASGRDGALNPVLGHFPQANYVRKTLFQREMLGTKIAVSRSTLKHLASSAPVTLGPPGEASGPSKLRRRQSRSGDAGWSSVYPQAQGAGARLG